MGEMIGMCASVLTLSGLFDQRPLATATWAAAGRVAAGPLSARPSRRLVVVVVCGSALKSFTATDVCAASPFGRRRGWHSKRGYEHFPARSSSLSYY